MSKKTNIARIENQPVGDYARKPYMVGKDNEDLSLNAYLRGADGGDTYRALMGRESYSVMERAIAMYLEHSQFKKPYMGDEFPEMEHFAGAMLGHQWYPSEWDVAYPMDGVLPQCLRVCDVAVRGFHVTGKDGHRCERVIYVTWNASQDDPIYIKSISYVDESVVPESVLKGEEFNEEDIPASKEGLTLIDSVSHSNTRQGFVFYVTPESVTKTILIVFEQPDPFLGTDCGAGGWDCTYTLEIEPCTLGEGECGIAYDIIRSDETVSDSTPANVYIFDNQGEGTNGPYNWSVTGTGFTLEESITSGVGNILNASGSACGTAEITVTASTPDCDPPAVGHVRDTTGQWTLLGTDAAASGYLDGNDGEYDPIGDYWEKIQGKYRVREAIRHNDEFHFPPNLDDCTITPCEDFLDSWRYDFEIASIDCTDYPGAPLISNSFPCCCFEVNPDFRVKRKHYILNKFAHEWTC